MKRTSILLLMIVTFLPAAPALAQLGGLGKALQKAKDVKDQLEFTDAEEAQLGAQVSEKLRDKYGVVQDKAVHKYVTLVGSVLAQASSRPGLPWTFIVLDTDGVNAFAAPGGYIHITRGALALIQDEDELACVLGHEISHVTQKHAINAIKKSKMVSVAGDLSRSDILKNVADKAYSIVLDNKFDRNDEEDADSHGIALANSVGYAPAGLSAFLTRLADRNKGLKEPSGLFASHPETQARLGEMTKVIGSQKLNATALVAPRYRQSIDFKVISVSDVASGSYNAPAPSSGSSGKFGLGGLGAVGGDKGSSQTISSAGSRGVNPDRDAKGGPVKTVVIVKVTQGEIIDFKKGISG